MLELVLPTGNLKYNSATDPLAFNPMPYTYAVLLSIFTAFQQKHQMPTQKNILRSTLTSHCLFFFLNHTVHENNLAESLHVWE